MKKVRRSRPRIAGVAGLMGVAAVAGAQTCGDGWLPGMGAPGVNGSITCSLMWDADGAGPQTPKLIVGGIFKVAGPIAANNVAAYDPQTGEWAALGEGVDAGVLSLAIAADGALIVGGTFLHADNQTARRIARWDGVTWSGLGEGFDDNVFAVCVMPNGDVIAGGIFNQSGATPLAKIARWNGAAWTALGSGVSGAGDMTSVNALTTVSSGLVVGGEFLSAGGQAAANVARWDGSAWHAMGSGFTSNVRAFTFWDSDGAGPLPARLVAGGDFTPNRAAIWTGATWSMLSGTLNGPIIALATRPNGELIAAGPVAGYVLRRGPSGWLQMSGGLNSPGQALANLPDGRLFVGGGFQRAGGASGIDVAGAAIWNGTSWSWDGEGINGATWSVAATHDGGALVGGWFTTIGDGVPARSIARWNGATWSRLGTSGVPSSSIINEVFERPGSGDVIAGGSFTSIDGVSAWAIARWNGAAWSAMGTGLRFGFSPGGVSAIAELPSGDLVVAGGFDSAGGLPANNVATWNGSTWSAMGNGIDGGVNDLVVSPTGEAFAVGPQTIEGLAYVQRWDGAAWSTFGEAITGGPGNRLNAVALLPDGTVVAAGRFSFAAGVPVNNIAYWNGLHWAALGQGVGGEIADMAVLQDGSIVVVGEFTSAGGQPARQIARWTGSAWHAMGSGIDSRTPWTTQVVELVNGEVAAIGDIATMEGRASVGFARWSFSGAPAVTVDPAGTTVNTGETLVLSATARAGFDGVSVEWRRGGKVIATESLESPTDGTPAQLVIEDAGPGDAGEYTARFFNECGESVSEPATVTVTGPACPTDFNGDGAVNSTDVSDFINAWFADQTKGTLVADWDGNGVVNSTDVSNFINDWFSDTLAGCGG